MRKWVYLFLLILSFSFFQAAKAQNISNEGTDFWAVFPTHDPSKQGNEVRLANITVFITSKDTATVTVSCGNYKEKKFIDANTSVGFDINRSDAYIESIDGESILENKGIHVVVVNGKTKVAAYAHIYAGFRSAASLILPVEALGQRYYSMNYTQDAGGRNFIVLVATEANTTVLIHQADGNIKTVAFKNPGDVYEYIVEPGVDLTGTYVEVDPVTSSCNKFGLFSGSTSDVIGGCVNSRDPLYQQLYPVNSWGKNYGIVPFFGRRYILRFLAQEDNTTVKFNGNTITLQKGKFYQSSALSTAGFVSADKLISVAQYSLTQDCSAAGGGTAFGDPDMVMLNPVEFNIKKVTLFSSDKQAISEKYINVCMKTAGTSSFKIDGAAPAGNWAVIPSNPIYSFIQIRVFNESITLTADVGFNAIACGFGSAESYAYSAGTSLANNNYLVVTDASDAAGVEKPDACLNVASDFKIQLPYMVSKIVWTLDAQSPYIDNAPIPVTITKNGEVFYEYTYAKNEVYSVSGPHKMHVLVDFLPTPGNCYTGSQSYDFDFNADALATADASFDKVVCADYPIQFTDASKSNAVGKLITSWHWDFGDGSTDKLSSEQNPKHTYQISGSFKVRLSVAVENGCNSEVKEFDITVLPKITAKFADVGMLCLNKEFVVEDKSEIESGASIVKWIWDFGDGTTEPPHLNKQLFTHKYMNTGSYNIKLIAVADNGCQSLAYIKNVKVHSLPKTNFNIPKACQTDAVVFENTSTNEDGPTTDLTYSWDFGDPLSPNNTSNTIDGLHTYSVAKNYSVKLTVTNTITGCTNSISQSVDINGATPKANFSVVDEDHLCSSKAVVVTNTSFVVEFGEITRLEWQPDFINHPEWIVVDNDPSPNKPRSFDYGKFDTPLSKSYRIRLVAFSGGSCNGEKKQDIIVLASPILKFEEVTPICVNAEQIKLTQASEEANLSGTGVYSGPGIIPDGSGGYDFNPALAGVNESGHNITYTFTADNGCPESITKKIIVMPKPSFTVDRDIYVLAGGQKTIFTQATGKNLSYLWAPSVGLDRADISSPIVTPERDTKYTITITSEQGCYVTGTVYVHVQNAIEVANTFSPNGDGVNDFWNIKYIDTYPNSTVEIFDRYGAKVYFSRGYSVPFDGNFKNQLLPVGTYYYIIDPKNGRNRKSGSLTLIR